MANRPNRTGNQENETPQTPEVQQNSGNPSGTNSTSSKALTAALRLPSSYPAGAPYIKTVDTWPNSTAPVYNKMALRCAPGVCVIGYIPTYGYSNSASSALNRAIYSEFNAVRSQISGNRPYEPADMMIYRMAVNSLRQLYFTIARIYKIARSYSATNLYKPRAILAAMGLDADDCIRNLSDMYAWLLSHETTLSPFPTVSVGTIDERHEKLCTYIFTDGDTDMSQMYIFNQEYYYSYENVDEVKGLTPRQLPATWAEIKVLWNDMHTALQQSSDVYTIAADVRRAYGDKVVTRLTAPEANAEVEYAKNDIILTSIMNAVPVICDRNSELGSLPSRNEDLGLAFRIYDDEHHLKCVPAIISKFMSSQTASQFWTMPVNRDYLNMVQANPSDVDFMAAVLFNVHITPFQDPYLSRKSYKVDAFGTEVITKCTYCTDPERTDMVTQVGGTIIWSNDVDTQYGRILPINTLIKAVSTISQFDWHVPISVGVAGSITTDDLGNRVISGGVDLFPIEDIQNYVPLSEEQRELIFEAYLLAQFNMD